MDKLSPPPAVFLLTTADPAQNGIGSIFIRDILARATDLKMKWSVEPPFLLRIGRSGRLPSAFNSLLVRIGPWQDLRFLLFRWFKLKQHVARIEQEFRASGASLMWITTSSPELICIAAHLAERGHDLRVTIWDAPEYLVQNLRFSGRTATTVRDHFERLMAQARGCSVVSETMRETYARVFPHLPLTVMRHGIASLQPPEIPAADGDVRFVFAGSLYSNQEWNAFVAALDLSEWQIAGRQVRLAFLGHFPLRGATRPPQLEHHAPMPQPEAMKTMAQMDIGYLPYWLDPSREFVARTSFPGKMTAYSAAGLAIFHHGPKTSSVTRFLERYPYGEACDSLDPGTILQHLERLVENASSAQHSRARTAAMKEALSDTAMIRAFKQLVGQPADRVAKAAK